jgi:hypothetical protein
VVVFAIYLFFGHAERDLTNLNGVPIRLMQNLVGVRGDFINFKIRWINFIELCACVNRGECMYVFVSVIYTMFCKTKKNLINVVPLVFIIFLHIIHQPYPMCMLFC